MDERTASDGSDLGPRLAHLFQVDAAGEPESARWIRPCSGAQAFLNGYRRWCLWLVDVDPALLRRLQHVLARIEQVKWFRRASKAATTRAFAATPTLFCQIAQFATDDLLVPRVSSERRSFVPMGFVDEDLMPAAAGGSAQGDAYARPAAALTASLVPV